MKTKARHTLIVSCAAATLGLLLAACSSGGSGLTTGSLLPSFKPKADEPTERAMMVAATSGRAVKCGYRFDPTQLRASYLAFEVGQGTAPEQMARIERVYDHTRGEVIKRSGPAEDYCDDARTAEIKRELTRHLAGDFKLPVKVVAPPSTRDSELDREKIFDPMARKSGL